MSQAATSLGVDASTVSRRLAALEEALDANLFDRGREGISKTKAAEDLFSVAEQIEAGMLEFRAAADTLEREVAGLVRMTCPPDVADVIVAPLLAGLHAKHPKLRIALDPGETLVDLTRREADLALRTVRPVRGDLIVTRLATVRWVLVAAPDLARELGTVRAWQDLPWVGFGERFAKIGPARWLEKYAPGLEPRVCSDSLTVQLAVVSNGGGVALIPDASVEHYGLAPLKLASKLKPDAAAWPRDELFLVTHRALRNVPRVKAVWELLVARFAGKDSGF